jgi:hypothetical protein
MNNEAAVLRLKAEACQRLAELTGTTDPMRKALRLTRADQWNALSFWERGCRDILRSTGRIE